MNNAHAAWLLIGLAALLANLPFINGRKFVFGPQYRPVKSLAFILIEWLCFLLMASGVAVFIETRFGPLYRQGWEFYVTVFALYLTFSFPGFVWRYLKRA